MLRFIIRRTFYSLLILIGVMILTFVLFRMAAGDPSSALLGKNPKPEEVERVRISLGADRPLFYGTLRASEAYTATNFRNGRTGFPGVSYEGANQPMPDGLLLMPGSSVILKRNFVPDAPNGAKLRVEADGPLAGSWSGSDRLRELEFSPKDEVPEEIRLTVPADAAKPVKLAKTEFFRVSDDPFDSQLVASLKEIVTFTPDFPYVSFFNFGNTLLTHESIRARLWRGMWPSLFVMLPIFFGELLFGIVFAMISCVWRGMWLDRVIMVLSVAGMSISYLALIIFGQWLLGYYWGWFPVWGWGSARYLALPVIIGIISGTGSGVRFYRTVFLNEINREYLRTAVAKGASPIVVYGKHLLKNSLIPIITRVSGILPFLFTGSLLLESFFGIPGLGSEGINALNNADLQMLKALVILSSFLFVVINLLTDIAYAYADPRMRKK